jgi:hypothetical protein
MAETTFYRWYDLHVALPRSPRGRSSRIEHGPGEVQRKLIDLALEPPDLSPRELAVRFIDIEKYCRQSLALIISDRCVLPIKTSIMVGEVGM